MVTLNLLPKIQKKVARCFYALEQGACRPQALSGCKSDEQLFEVSGISEFQEYIAAYIQTGLKMVDEIKTRMLRGKEIAEQINILGDDGVPVEYHITFWKSS